MINSFPYNIQVSPALGKRGDLKLNQEKTSKEFPNLTFTQ